MDATAQEESEFVSWAREELSRAGLFEEDSDYGGMLGDELMRMVEVFADAGHSGMSAMMASMIFRKLVRREALTPIGDKPDEWMHIADGRTNGEEVWQCRRQPSLFSHDGGMTYYDIEEDLGAARRLLGRILKRPLWKMHRSEAVHG